MSVFASIQQVLNVFNQLYGKLGAFPACSLLFLLWCQYQNWTVCLNGGAVQCKPVDNLSKEQVNDRCWKQMVSDCSTRGALIRFFMVIETVKGRAFLGDRLAEMEKEGGRLLLPELSERWEFYTRLQRSVGLTASQDLLEELSGLIGIALPHRQCSANSLEASKWIPTLDGLHEKFWMEKMVPIRAWRNKLIRWRVVTGCLHPLLAKVEIGRSRVLLRALKELLAANNLGELLLVLWGELAMGGAAAVVEAVVDETERTRARKDVNGEMTPTFRNDMLMFREIYAKGSAVVVDETERTRARKDVHVNYRGQTCPYVFLPYQYLAFAVGFMMIHATVGYSYRMIASGDPEAGLQELTVRLGEAEKLEKAKMRDKLAEIADDILYYALNHRAHNSPCWLVLKGLLDIITYAPMCWSLYVVVFDRSELLNEMGGLPSRFWSLSVGVPWNKVPFPVAGFPRFRECTLGRMTATGVDKAVVLCELSLDALNVIALSCLGWSHLFSVAFVIVRFLWLLGLSTFELFFGLEDVANKCDQDEKQLLVSLEGRVGVVVFRELVYVLMRKRRPQDEEVLRTEGVLRAEVVRKLIEPQDCNFWMGMLFLVYFSIVAFVAVFGSLLVVNSWFPSLGSRNLDSFARPVILAVLAGFPHLLVVLFSRGMRSYVLGDEVVTSDSW